MLERRVLLLALASVVTDGHGLLVHVGCVLDGEVRATGAEVSFLRGPVRLQAGARLDRASWMEKPRINYVLQNT